MAHDVDFICMLDNKQIIIFDFDGTLVDTMHVFADVASRLISENYGLDRESARKKYFETSGFPFCKQIEIIFPGHELNQKIASVYEAEKIEATSDVIMERETREILKILKDRGYELAVSSNNFQHNISRFIENNRLGGLFRLALGFKDGFGKGKEHFDFIKNTLGLNSRELVFVGDSLNDYRLARENDVDFIGKIGTFPKSDFVKLDKGIKCISNIKDLVA